MKIQNWLDDNFIKYSIENENDFTIPDIGLFHFIGDGHKQIFDADFNFLVDTDYPCDFLVYEFGGNIFYVAKDKITDVKLQLLKYVGKVKKEVEFDYVNLGVRGSYELLNGSGLYSDYCKKAKFLGHEFLGTCEYNTLAGSIVFQSACKDAGIKPIIGETVNLRLGDNKYVDIKLYVKSEKGWRNLLRINAEINIFNPEQYVTIEAIQKYSKDLICVVGVDFDFTNFRETFDEIFGEDFYCNIDVTEFKSQKRELEHLQQTKRFLEEYVESVSAVVISDTFYVDKDYSHVKKLLNGVGNVKFQNESGNQHYKTIDEVMQFTEMMSSEYFINNFLVAIAATHEIAEKCSQFQIDTKSMKLPKYNLKEIESNFVNSEELFISKIEEGFILKISGQVEDEQVYRDRINKEIDIIRRGGFIDYFLILWDVMMYCKANDILTGIGRGSAGGSLVSYLLDIIHLDPIKYNLLFERFLNEGRFDSVPDIDCDFEGLRRDDVKRYMENRFGLHSVASIGSYTTIKVKSGLKDIGRALGYDHKTVNIMTSYLGDDMEGAGDDIMQLFKAAQVNPYLKKFVVDNVELVNVVMILIRNHRSSSVHASGVLVVPQTDKDGVEMEIYDWLPVKKTKEGVLITEWEGIYLDKCKFVKEDILGIAQLDKWSYTLKLIEEHTGRKINIHKDIPVDCEETYRMFSIGYNDDVFQFGSDSQKNYSVLCQPQNIEHLIAMNALYRPGPMESNAHVDFYKIKHGDKDAEIDSGMENITGSTYGLWVYQEQIMEAYRMITDITLTEADNFRKFVVKVKWYRHLFASEYERYHSMFINGYVEKIGVTAEYAQGVWDKIVAFAEYGFNRSHAAAYAITGYYCQYLKVHYPLQFWTTSLHFSREEELHKRISEINRSGQNIELMPPEINQSGHKFYANPDTNKIYWSFQKVKFCGSTSIDVILAEREKNGNFYSLEEFIKRVPKKNVNKRTITYMIMAGCFDEIENIYSVEDRKQLISKHAEICKHKVDDEFKGANTNADYWWLIKQKEACGFGYIKYDKILRKNGFNQKYYNEIEFAQNSAKGKDVMFAGIVLFINKKKTKHGDAFAELKCEVNSEIIFVTIWPEKYDEYMDTINKSLNKIVLVTGTVDFNRFKNQNVLMTNDNTKIVTFEI